MKCSLLIPSLALVLAAATPALLRAQTLAGSCGDLANAYGPYDFRHDRDKLPIVLGAHFKPEVEALIRGTTATTPGHDIDYTLRAIPNHPGALLAVIRLGVKEKTDLPIGMRYTVECWLERAIRFRSDDSVVRMIYATYLSERQRKPEAMKQLEVVEGLAKDNPFTHYNLGMIYADMKEYERALKQAHLAMELGFRQTALRDKLTAAGRWQEPVEAADPAASAASATLATSEAAPAASQASR